jgi:hypothetical protein
MLAPPKSDVPDVMIQLPSLAGYDQLLAASL